MFDVFDVFEVFDVFDVFAVAMMSPIRRGQLAPVPERQATTDCAILFRFRKKGKSRCDHGDGFESRVLTTQSKDHYHEQTNRQP